MAWKEEFPPEYRIPREIEDLVHRGILQDTSWSLDASPSFSARLMKGWIRLWVEHPELKHRLGGSLRYSVEVTKNLNIPGRRLIEDDDLGQVMPTLMAAVENLGYRRHWRLLE
jgi:hypothetical protein